jgi:hypothetical protein
MEFENLKNSLPHVNGVYVHKKQKKILIYDIQNKSLK